MIELYREEKKIENSREKKERTFIHFSLMCNYN